MDISTLALALGSSLTAGFNLYLTVLTLGMLHRYEFLTLPSGMDVLANPWVLGVAAVLFLTEFFADKIPYVDTLWDVFQGFIRIPAGAILAYAAVGDVPAHLQWSAALAGGFVSFTSHGAKASTRLAANASPEPFSNWALSLIEDGVTLIVLWLVTTHPYVALFLVVALIGLCLVLIYVFYRFFRMVFRALKRPARSPVVPSAG